jgi:hypothetical protein
VINSGVDVDVAVGSGVFVSCGVDVCVGVGKLVSVGGIVGSGPQAERSVEAMMMIIDNMFVDEIFVFDMISSVKTSLPTT